jgi:hypothetical protein
MAMLNERHDDVLTVCAISVVAAIFGNVIHEGLGHAATALLTGAQSGILSTVAWSSEYDSRLVAAAGTLANLAAAIVFWSLLRGMKRARAGLRFFLVISLAFNLFTGTGYFLFSGFTNFGDWAQVIAGLRPVWMWRTALILVGAASYYGAVLIVGSALVRYAGIPRGDSARLRRLTLIPYVTSIVILTAGGLMNPLGMQLVWQSALPASAGATSGLLWLQYYIPKGTIAARPPDAIDRSYVWIICAAAAATIFVFVLGRGIHLHR